LTRQGTCVRCLVRPGSDAEGLRKAVAPAGEDLLEIYPGSLGRLAACPDVADGCDVVFHLAAAATGATAVLFRENVIGTRELIDVVGRGPVRRFVLVSSLAVYGTGALRAGDVLDERCPLDPQPHRRDPYTYSKVVQEQVAWEAHRQGRLPLVLVRPGVLYGAGRDCLTTRVGLRLGNVLVKMGGRQPLPYTFVDNCAEAVALAGLVPGVEGEAFNIVDDNPPTADDLVTRYRREVRPLRVVPVYHAAIAPLSGLFEWYQRRSCGQLPAVLTRYKSTAQWKVLAYANAKAKTRLGWRPRIGFAEGLQETFTWLRERPLIPV
jgi:nucleoside-diphosphate-sugar epimerase